TFNTNNTRITATGVNASTEYCFTIKANDAPRNHTDFSNQACETTTNTGTGTDCIVETIENIPANSASYAHTSRTGDDGGAWTATKARTDETIVGKAITIDVRNNNGGSLTSPTVNGGINELTVTTQRKYGGSNGNLDLFVNGVLKG